MKSFVNYALEGYDPADGLDETCGRWMYDDERRCQVWVQTSVQTSVPVAKAVAA